MILGLWLISARSLQLECVRVLYDSLLVTVLTYSSETMIGREKERSRIRVVQIDNLRGMRVSGEWIKSRMHG